MTAVPPPGQLLQCGIVIYGEWQQFSGCWGDGVERLGVENCRVWMLDGTYVLALCLKTPSVSKMIGLNAFVCLFLFIFSLKMTSSPNEFLVE